MSVKNLFRILAASAIAAVGLVGPTSMAGASGQSALLTISPATQSHASGLPQIYHIALSCQGTLGAQCGPNLTLTIPLDTSTTPSMTDTSWKYSATSGDGGILTSGPTVSGSNLVMGINSASFIGGYSGSVTLVITPPNFLTSNNTGFDVRPTLTGTAIGQVSSPTPAHSTVTAAPIVGLSSTTADGGQTYTPSSPVSVVISATCQNGASGILDGQTATLTSLLPAQMTYVSSSPAGTYNAGTRTVTWNFSSSDLSTFPKGCRTGANGTNSFTVNMTSPPTVPYTTIALQNSFSVVGLDATNPSGVTSTATANTFLQFVTKPPVTPFPGYATVTKLSMGPLAQSGITTGNQYIGTYAGNWLPVSATPLFRPGYAAGSYQTTINFGIVGQYQTKMEDPMPCLANPIGNVYTSMTSGGICANPAFHLQVFGVSATSLVGTQGVLAAYNAGWRPQLVLTDGSVINAAALYTPATTFGYFVVPAGAKVATVILPTTSHMMSKQIILTVWGYVDASLNDVNHGINTIKNICYATTYLDGQESDQGADYNYLTTVPNQPQLGISKTFGTTGGGPSGSTVMTLAGQIKIPITGLANDVVFSDLLPSGMSWTNPTSSATVTLVQGGAQRTTTATAMASYLTNYDGSARNLIRISIPASNFAPGSYDISFPANYFLVSTPVNTGVYVNNAEIILKGLYPGQINDACTTPGQTQGGLSTAQFLTDNSADFAGDGKTSEGYCQSTASLAITTGGAAFTLTKTVQGDQDAVAKGALGIGQASVNGWGRYVLQFANTGTDTLNNVVIYDILPYLGDTGVSGGQSNVNRSTEFVPLFASITQLPSGVTVQYSQSTNPCRNEVFAVNPSCVNDWSSSLPSDPTTVTALRFFASANYAPGTTFSVGFQVTTPSSGIGKIAWNSAAENASDVSHPSATPLPAEPPKVGITVPLNPTLTTQAASDGSHPGSHLSDQITVTGNGGANATISWILYGPITPNSSGTCSGLDWTSAPEVSTGSLSTTSQASTGNITARTSGCYSFAESADVTGFTGAVTSTVGQDAETILITPATPSVVTQIAGVATEHDSAWAWALHDNITVSGSSITSDSPAILQWTLYGPVAAVNGSCASVNWTGATQVATGNITITGDGAYASAPTTVSAPGCYTFNETMTSTTNSTAAATDLGLTPEVWLVTTPLPFTGFYVNWDLAIGSTLVVTGLGVVVWSHRRRRGRHRGNFSLS